MSLTTGNHAGLKSYAGLIRCPTFLERFQYVKLDGIVGRATFGHDRYLNQLLYRSREWRDVRRAAIRRDEGRDLAMDGYEIYDGLVLHHIIPITIDDIHRRSALVFDLDNLVCTTVNTHNAIHYGDATLLAQLPPARERGDTRLW